MGQLDIVSPVSGGLAVDGIGQCDTREHNTAVHATRYWATKPPQTGIGSPVTNDDASEHSHNPASAISSGLPIRCIGSAAKICSSLKVPLSSTRSTIGV